MKNRISFVIATPLEEDFVHRKEMIRWLREVCLGEVSISSQGEMYLRFEVLTFVRQDDALAFKLKFPFAMAFENDGVEL